jgi:hypothetical protein
MTKSEILELLKIKRTIKVALADISLVKDIHMVKSCDYDCSVDEINNIKNEILETRKTLNNVLDAITSILCEQQKKGIYLNKTELNTINWAFRSFHFNRTHIDDEFIDFHIKGNALK